MFDEVPDNSEDDSMDDDGYDYDADDDGGYSYRDDNWWGADDGKYDEC